MTDCHSTDTVNETWTVVEKKELKELFQKALKNFKPFGRKEVLIPTSFYLQLKKLGEKWLT